MVFTARRVCIARTMPWQDVSVCPSVRHTLVLCVNGYTYPQSFFTVANPTILVFPYQTGWQYSDGDPHNGGAECKGAYKKIMIATNIGLYLGTDARQSHSYYGTRIGNRPKLSNSTILNDLE